MYGHPTISVTVSSLLQLGDRYPDFRLRKRRLARTSLGLGFWGEAKRCPAPAVAGKATARDPDLAAALLVAKGKEDEAMTASRREILTVRSIPSPSPPSLSLSLPIENVFFVLMFL